MIKLPIATPADVIPDANKIFLDIGSDKTKFFVSPDFYFATKNGFVTARKKSYSKI